ncbi:hypothetical protein DFP76_105356 [Marinomonas aquiplantarum]|uniref:Uncharacterized protein n=1 Tax=Marinomonas aquiplantarum TaxID=491951 RepID=A0A366CYG1_9GAMM|nr:hypothetical protein DFP76_105356 [Marinomonas aquiplantarum]
MACFGGVSPTQIVTTQRMMKKESRFEQNAIYVQRVSHHFAKDSSKIMCFGVAQITLIVKLQWKMMMAHHQQPRSIHVEPAVTTLFARKVKMATFGDVLLIQNVRTLLTMIKACLSYGRNGKTVLFFLRFNSA